MYLNQVDKAQKEKERKEEEEETSERIFSNKTILQLLFDIGRKLQC